VTEFQHRWVAAFAAVKVRPLNCADVCIGGALVEIAFPGSLIKQMTL